MLILSQCLYAKKVASFKTQSKLGLKVKKGSKGIKVLVPIPYKYEKEELTKDSRGKAIFRIIKRVIHILVSCIFDKKRNNLTRAELKSLFYNKILNDITTALSLCDKSNEIESKDKNLSIIYLYEAFYYLELACKSLIKENIIEINNDKRINNKEFIEDMNPKFLLYVYQLCYDKLEQLEDTANQIKDVVLKEKIENLKRDFDIKLTILRQYLINE